MKIIDVVNVINYINHEKSCNGLSILTCPKCMKIFSHINNKNK